jgi:predicted MFS family arabinose efflux permease
MMASASAADDIDGGYAWMRLVVSVLLGTVGSVGMWSVVVVLPAVQSEFDVARADASLPYTLTMVGFAAGNVLIGRFVDRTGIVMPMMVAAAALGLGYVLAATVTSIYAFALLQCLIGFGASATFGGCCRQRQLLRRRDLAAPDAGDAAERGLALHLCGDRPDLRRRYGAARPVPAPPRTPSRA